MYFKLEHFNTSIPVAITAMLVMYTLNQSISSKLPPTAYVKFIDIWLLFGLSLPFFIIIIIVLIEHLPCDMVQDFKEPFIQHQARVKYFGQIILPILEILFVCLYCFRAMSYYNED